MNDYEYSTLETTHDDVGELAVKILSFENMDPDLNKAATNYLKILFEKSTELLLQIDN